MNDYRKEVEEAKERWADEWERPKGHWIYTGKKRPTAPESVRCSECGFWYYQLTPRFYYSNCGAKMDNAERTYKNE